MKADAVPAVDADEVLVCARELVRAASENPPGNEAAPAAVAKRWCEGAGLQVETIEPEPGRANVIATLDSGAPGPTLVFNGHMDVVPIVDESLWEHPPFEAVVEQGILHGRGSCDMKGAIAAAICAAKALRGTDFAGKFVIQCVADEEVFGPLGTITLRDRGFLRGDAAIVGEPTQLSVGVAQRGLFWTRITTHGVAAHGSIPHKGVSAIESMARLVTQLRTKAFVRTHPLLGPPTINVGSIRGGGKINIVPAICAIEVDERVLPGDDYDDLVAEMEAEVQALEIDATIEVTNYAAGYELPADLSIVRLALDAHEAVRRQPTSVTGMMGATDAAILNKEGVPSIVFGPGSLALAHTTRENVEVAELADAARMYAWIASRFLATT
ncbi:MAG: M20 family metallopeptidase [Actinomycetota bacterium]|nr:M20 family metallopeptidase [Actinomycetota bacterium]